MGVAVCMIGVPLMIWADFNAGRSHSTGKCSSYLHLMIPDTGMRIKLKLWRCKEVGPVKVRSSVLAHM